MADKKLCQHLILKFENGGASLTCQNRNCNRRFIAGFKDLVALHDNQATLEIHVTDNFRKDPFTEFSASEAFKYDAPVLSPAIRKK